MKKKFGAIISIALTLALVLSLATTALAGYGNGGKGNKGAGPQPPKGGFADKASKNDMPGLGKNKKPNPSIKNGAPEEAIAALSDADKKTLNVYIDAYEDAVVEAIAALESAQKGDDLSEYRKSVMSALKTLLKAAKDNGIVLKTSMSSIASINGQLCRNWNGKDFNITIEEALAALTDEEKEVLREFIDAYEDAVADAEEAKENADEEDDLSAYHEAVMTAVKELLKAAEEADIDLGVNKFFVLKGDHTRGDWLGWHWVKAVTEAIADLDDDDKDALSDYIEDFEDALDAAEEAKENADEDDDLSSYREAVAAALKDLLDAAKEADIDLGLIKNCGR